MRFQLLRLVGLAVLLGAVSVSTAQTENRITVSGAVVDPAERLSRMQRSW